MYYAFTDVYGTKGAKIMKITPIPSKTTFSVATALILVLVVLMILAGVLPAPR